MLRQIDNPPNPYSPQHVEWIDCPPISNLIVYEEHCKTAMTSNDSPDVGFSFSVNPYRGCFHGCAYCYARPTHQYLDFGAGTDFERKIVAKVNAAEKLREEFLKKSWKGDTIVFSGVTDCYQPLESSFELTRSCLKVCLEFQNPVALITKGALIRRDIDILSELNRRASVFVFMSIAFSDDKMSKEIEPFAPRPSVRFRAMEALHNAGIPVGVGIAPVIPGLNESQIPSILEQAKSCGAEKAFMTLLRLPREVKDVFLSRLKLAYPTRYARVVNQLKEMKGGVLNRADFDNRMKGDGPKWEAIDFMFGNCCEKFELNRGCGTIRPSTFKRPQRQLEIFS